MRFGLRGKLILAVGIYLALLALVGALGLYAAQASLSGMHEAHEHNVREISLLANLNSAMDRVQSTVILHVLTQSDAEQAAYEAQIADLEREVDSLFDQQIELQRAFGDEADLARLNTVRAAWRAYLLALNREFLPLSRDDRDLEALAVARDNGPLAVAYDQAISELTSAQLRIEDESRERLDIAESNFASNRDRLLVALVAAGVTGVTFGLWQASRLAAAIGAVSRAAHRVATGDFAERVEVRTGDEIESLAESFNAMTANLQRMHEEEEAVERLKDEFVSMVSHELRTPLNGVIGMTDLLLQSDLAPRARRYAEGVQRSGEVLLAVIDDILDLSKIEAGKLDLESEPFDLREIVDDVVQLFAHRASAKGVELITEVDPELPGCVQGDPMRVKQVLLNLAGNAVKFTDSGSVHIRARAQEIRPDATLVRFEVIDTGIGIAEADRERLFEPFAQADTSTTRKYGGTGLGLPICKRLVGLMGGDIGVHSALGQGSTFWFTLPLPRVHAAAGVRESNGAGPNPLQVPRPDTAPPAGVRVLVVEDSWMNQQVALGMLDQLGYAADVADDGREALEVLDHTSYAAVLLDCQMPGMDGFEMAAELRRREQAAGRSPVPIIAITASATQADRERCLASGMNDHLPKPVHLADLSAKLARWLPQPQPEPHAEQPAAHDDQAVLDRAALAEIARLQRPGRPDLVTTILERFTAEAPARVEALRGAVAARDNDAVYRQAHALKGDCRRIGAIELGGLCARLESLGRDADLDQADRVADELPLALDRLRQALQTFHDERSVCAS